MQETRARSVDQNAKLHAMCRDLARQLEWGGRRWDEETWKRLLLAAKFGQKLVPNPLEDGFVLVNAHRSRNLSVEQMAELLGEVEAFGAMSGVKWTDDE